jgi:hypothetical protein
MAPTRFELAAPFLGSALLLVLGSCISLAIESRLKGLYAEVIGQAKLKGTEQTTQLNADALANLANWTTDASQIASLILGPTIGLALLHRDLESWAVFLYLVLMILAVAACLVFIFLVRPESYPQAGLVISSERRPWLRVKNRWIFTPVAQIGIAVSLAAAAVSAFVPLFR